MTDTLLEQIKAAEALADAHEAFITAEINYQATPQDRGGNNGPKGKALKAVREALQHTIDTLAAFRAAQEKNDG